MAVEIGLNKEQVYRWRLMGGNGISAVDVGLTKDHLSP